MKKLNREIIKKAQCNVLDTTLTTKENHIKDLSRRLKKQEKALIKTINKGWTGKEIIEKSISDINHTLSILNQF